MDERDAPQSASTEEEARIAETPAIFVNKVFVSPLGQVLDDILEDGSEARSAVVAIRLLMLIGCRPPRGSFWTSCPEKVHGSFLRVGGTWTICRISQVSGGTCGRKPVCAMSGRTI